MKFDPSRICISFEMAKYLVRNQGDMGPYHTSVKWYLVKIVQKAQGEYCLANGDKIMYRKEIGWFIKTY